jgi:dTDP-L-rhamnose 4-epimerase
VSLHILITGGAGFIGSRLAGQLLGAGHRVTVLDVLHPQIHIRAGRPRDLPDGAVLLPSDVTSPAAWHAALLLDRPDVIVHLAAETGTGQSLTEASRHGLVNVVGTTQMLDGLTQAGIRPAHIVLASSRAVYGEGPWSDAEGTVVYPRGRRHEDLLAAHWDPVGAGGEPLRPLPSRAAATPPHPINIYAATKLAQEHICQAWCAANDTALSVLRLQNVYGPGQAPQNSYTGIVTLFGRLATSGATLDIYEDGEITRDFVYVDDVINALSAAIDRPPSQDRLVDVGSGHATTIGQVARTVARLAGAPEPRVSGRFRDGDVRAASCSIDATISELGWAPAWTLEAGLDESLKWMTEQAALLTSDGS